MKKRVALMHRVPLVVLAIAALVGLLAAQLSSGQSSPKTLPPDPKVTTPKAFFGYNIGEDFKLTPWLSRDVPGEGKRKGIVDYDRELQRTSNRVRVFPDGTSEMGRPLMLTVITAPENWARIDKLKGITNKLADPRQVASDEEAKMLAQQGKPVYWVDSCIHASERTGAETLTQLSYATASKVGWISDVTLLFSCLDLSELPQ